MTNRDIIEGQFKIYELMETVYLKNYYNPNGDKDLLPQLQQGLAEVKNTIIELASARKQE